MTIRTPIGYPTGNPMHSPSRHPNRGRIARPVSCRPVSSPLTSVETSHHDVAYVTRVAAAPAPVEPRDDMMSGANR